MGMSPDLWGDQIVSPAEPHRKIPQTSSPTPTVVEELKTIIEVVSPVYLLVRQPFAREYGSLRRRVTVRPPSLRNSKRSARAT